MGRHYSTRDFSGRCRTGCWPAIFERRSVLTGLDFAAMNKTQPEELFAAWLELPEVQRNEMDAEMREIHA